MKFSIVIPVFNGADKILRTIESIRSQSSTLSGENEFECLVVDGASHDGTVDVVQELEDDRFKLISEPDNGMYDALAKGLRKVNGNICCYLPAGEVLDAHAFSTVSDIFSQNSKVSWLTGMMVVKNEKLQVIDAFLPPKFKADFLRKGIYGTRLHVVQQESTFWRTDLNALIDYDVLSSCKLAGDFFLWKCFSEQHELFVVNSMLCAFTVEPGQLSGQVKGAYRNELRSLRDKPSILDEIWAMVLREVYSRIRPSRRAKGIFRFNTNESRWILR